MIDDGWRVYFVDLQNYMQIWGTFGMWVPMVNWWLNGDIGRQSWLNPVNTITIVATWLTMLGYLKGFKLTGSLVRMLIAVILDMRGFVLLLFMLIMGFSAALSLLLSHEEGFTMREAPLTVFNMMLGNIEMYWFDDPHDITENKTYGLENGLEIQSGDLTSGTRDSWVSVVADAVFVFFNALIVIIMLNLLIAILGNTYSRIARHEKVQMEFERARCIYEIERHFLPVSTTDGCFGVVVLLLLCLGVVF